MMMLKYNFYCPQCLKIAQNVAFLILKYWHFLPIIVLSKLTFLVTLFAIFNETFSVILKHPGVVDR